MRRAGLGLTCVPLASSTDMAQVALISTVGRDIRVTGQGGGAQTVFGKVTKEVILEGSEDPPFGRAQLGG